MKATTTRQPVCASMWRWLSRAWSGTRTGVERVVIAGPVLRTEVQCKKSVGQAHAALPRLGEGEPPLAAAALRTWVRTSIVSLPRSAPQCQGR
jgi:hypothetical protein